MRSEKKDTTFSAMAVLLSNLSTCDRSHVGAIITRDGRCISWGYNGAPPGLPHCDRNNHGWGDDPDEWEKDPIYALGGI